MLIERYFDAPPHIWESTRDGIRMTFHDRVIPLGAYFAALEAAGLVTEALREPSANGLLPLFLQLRAAKNP